MIRRYKEGLGRTVSLSSNIRFCSSCSSPFSNAKVANYNLPVQIVKVALFNISVKYAGLMHAVQCLIKAVRDLLQLVK